MKRIRVLFLIAAAMLLTGISGACGESESGPAATEDKFPEKPITVMVPYNAGGATDFQARVVTMASGKDEFLGQPTVIVNKPGAGGMVGWNWFVSEAQNDGYTLTAYNVPHFIAQSIVFPSNAEYGVEEFEPIINWGADPAVLVVAKDSSFDTLEDFLAYARENPGKTTVSGGGMFVGHHIAVLQLGKAAAVELTYVPYTGGVPALTAVVNGDVLSGFNNLSDVYRSRDRLKILAVADLTRNEEYLPNVPTFIEQGVDVDDTSTNFRGLGVPTGTDPAIIEKLADSYFAQLSDPEVREKMEASGSPLRPMTREEARTMWDERAAFLESALAEYVEQ